MCGTIQFPVRCIWWTISMPIASKLFHGSCAARPGSANASATSTSTVRGGGRSRRGITRPFYFAKGKGSRSCLSPGGILKPLGCCGRCLLAVAAAEFLHPARGVDDLLLPGVERVRLGRDLDLDHRILLAVGPLHRLAALRVDRRAREHRVVGRGVEKDHRMVGRMDS